MPALAIIFMIIAVTMLVGMNTLVKLIGPDYHAFQVTFLRNLVAAFVLTPFIMKEGGLAALRTRWPFRFLPRRSGGGAGAPSGSDLRALSLRLGR
jgi:drug/metabolite transporter (DMT)-like permease